MKRAASAKRAAEAKEKAEVTRFAEAKRAAEARKEAESTKVASRKAKAAAEARHFAAAALRRNERHAARRRKGGALGGSLASLPDLFETWAESYPVRMLMMAVKCYCCYRNSLFDIVCIEYNEIVFRTKHAARLARRRMMCLSGSAATKSVC